MSAALSPSAVHADIACQVGVYLFPGQVTELRGLFEDRKKPVCGIYRDVADLARAAADLDARGASGTYITPNPLRSDMPDRSANAGDVIARHWLLIDVDPVRPIHTSSSDPEQAAAWEVLHRARVVLEDAGLTGPVVVDSGNGWHLCYPVDLPNGDDARNLIKSVLEGLDARCSDATSEAEEAALKAGQFLDAPRARVDSKMFDAPRIWKCPGTHARKGKPTSERPHRVARLVEGEPWAEEPARRNTEALCRLLATWQQQAQAPVPMLQESGARTYANAALRDECAIMAAARPGNLNNQLVRSAFKVGTLVQPGALTRDEAESAILDAAQQAGCDNPGKDRDTVRRGLEAGMRSPRDLSQVTGRRALIPLAGETMKRDSREPEEEPPPAEPTWPEPPGEDAFHGLAGRIVRTIEPASEAASVALLVQVLAGFGNIIYRRAHFIVESDRHHGNEFVVLVGRSSKARKGTSWGRIKNLLCEAEEEWSKNRVQSGLSSGEGLLWAVRDPIMKREKMRGEKGEPVRYEEVEADPGILDKRLLVYEPEFANVLKQAERQGNTLSTHLRQAWDGGHLQSMVKNSPACATNAHISLIGHITAEELRRYLTVTETANGFGNRHLWICTQRSKLLPEGGRVDPQAWDRLREELVEAIAFGRTAGEVWRDDEARDLWREVYGQLSEGRPGLAGALLGRAEAHVMRLAMLYALLDRSATIGAAHLMAALTLWEYCERSVYYVFGESLGDPVADDLLRLLQGCPSGLTRTEIRDYFGRHQSSERISRALGLLLQNHLARKETRATEGRPAELWFATRGRQPAGARASVA